MGISLLVLFPPFIKVYVGVLMWAGVSGETLSSIMHDGVWWVNRMLHKKMSCRATSSTHKGRPQSTGPCHWVLHKHLHNRRMHHITQTSHINHGYHSLPVVPLVSNCKINSEATEGPKSTAPPHTNIAPLFLLCLYGIASIAFQVGTTVVFVILWQLWSLTRKQ